MHSTTTVSPRVGLHCGALSLSGRVRQSEYDWSRVILRHLPAYVLVECAALCRHSDQRGGLDELDRIQ